jgi:nickel transport protein
VHARKFHKAIIEKGPRALFGVGQRFEVTPLNEASPCAEEWLELRVQSNDKAVQGAKLSLGEDGPPAMTDTRGLAKIQVAMGTNHIR